MPNISQVATRGSHDVNVVLRDWLTQLPNQYGLWRQLRREVRRARRSNYCFAVMFIDVDAFKRVNDSHGHFAGDKVLRAVGRHLRANVRPDDEVFRYGGDEFIVLMKEIVDLADVRRIAQRLGKGLLAKGKTFDGTKWRARVTMSIGAAIVSGPAATSAEAIERADRAMYQAKSLGRNGQFVLEEPQPQHHLDIGIRRVR